MREVEQADCPVIHTFNDGQYIRELQAKAGTIIVGHKFKKRQINIMLKGKIALLTPDGWRVLEAPQYFIGEPARKIAYVIEDMAWLNVIKTKLTNVDDIEREIYDWSDVPEVTPQTTNRLEDVIDYAAALYDIGLTPEQVETLSKADNVLWQDTGSFKFKISKSEISGMGVIATADFAPGEYIGPVRSATHRYPLGRYTNHAKEPNAEFRVHGESVHLYAIKSIKGCKGGTNGDEIVIDYRDNFRIAMEIL